MKQNKIVNPCRQDGLLANKQRVAFHEAGHVAGIHFNNKARHLSPIPFRIILKKITCNDDHVVKVKGGRLIELLPKAYDGFVRKLTEDNDVSVQLVADYRMAIEADIISLLIGPLAEAKHIANTDNELFNLNLINPKALGNYGGSSNIALVNEYLQCFYADKHNDENLDELFSEAFNFVNNDANWSVITQLAEYILGSNKSIIFYEEIVTMLDQSMANFTDRRSKVRNNYNGWFKETVRQIKHNYTLSDENLERPSQLELDSMSQIEKDALIMKLFDSHQSPNRLANNI